MSSINYLPDGLDTQIDYGLSILQWLNCDCARYSWGNTAHTLVNDVYGHPIIYLVAFNPSSAPTVQPSNPSMTPSLVPTTAPAVTKSPTVVPYNLKYRGGRINPNAVVKLIFWGNSWMTNPGDKISGLELFYQGWSGSPYSSTVTEYTGSNGQVTNSITYTGYVIDSSTPKSIDPFAILVEVCAMIPKPDPSGNGYYVVYTEITRGSNSFCGWHASGACKGVRIQFGFIFNVDNDPGCIPSGTIPSNPGWKMSPGMHGLASITAHELSEMITDPGAGDGWVDIKGMENGDKCAWTFPPTNSVFSNGITWRIQGEWSNQAAHDQKGYPTTSSVYGTVFGCVGSPPK